MFNIGDRVNHFKFGNGTVKNWQENEARIIEFDSGVTYVMLEAQLALIKRKTPEPVFPPNCS